MQVVAEQLILEDLGVELGAFLGVLQDAWDLNGACPVDVVEALREDELLQHAFFRFGVREYHTVVIWHCGTAIRCLRHYVEVVVVGYDVRSD